MTHPPCASVIADGTNILLGDDKDIRRCDGANHSASGLAPVASDGWPRSPEIRLDRIIQERSARVRSTRCESSLVCRRSRERVKLRAVCGDEGHGSSSSNGVVYVIRPPVSWISRSYILDDWPTRLWYHLRTCATRDPYKIAIIVLGMRGIRCLRLRQAAAALDALAVTVTCLVGCSLHNASRPFIVRRNRTARLYYLCFDSNFKSPLIGRCRWISYQHAAVE